MLIVPGDEDCRSVGSFFKNPVLSEDQFKELAERAASKGVEIPSYPALDAKPQSVGGVAGGTLGI